ncbi:MAG: lysophospholipid acyltransferase family protein [Rhodobacteraceae bacterium]|nr:lysophospholipid acyltransferase family protein [Paracoccaceae bacterium]
MTGKAPTESRESGFIRWIRFLFRWLFMAIVIYGLLVLFLIIRLFEWPWGRPLTPGITQLACKASLRIMGLKSIQLGYPMQGGGIIVANHIGWLDIFTLNAATRLIFVAKSEVAGWPGIGILAKATGAVFVERDPKRALRQHVEFRQRLAVGDRLVFFPEGTSTDGRRVLAFKSTLFAACFGTGAGPQIQLQPVTLSYWNRRGEHSGDYAYWGEIGFGESLFSVLSKPGGGSARIEFHQPVDLRDFTDRKQLAAHCENIVRAGLEHAQQTAV